MDARRAAFLRLAISASLFVRRMQRQQAVSFFLDHRIALAAKSFERRPVQHCNLSTLVLDYAALLKPARRFRHSLAANAEHVSDQLLGHR
jgi:hypothetical protein